MKKICCDDCCDCCDCCSCSLGSKILNLFKRNKPRKINGAEIITPSKKPKAPKMDRCKICDKKLALTTGFLCDYCNEWHCEKHRLPEKHKCKKIQNKISSPRNWGLKYKKD